MLNKKEELDTLKALSEKDLWCQDLDEFVAVWNARLAEEQDISKKIRGMGRRASKKIGAGKGSKMHSRLKVDDDYAPKAPKPQKANPTKGVVKVQPEKSSQKFLNMFAAKPKPIARTDSYGTDGAAELSGMSDDEFAEVAATKTSRAPSEQPVGGRSKRAAAAKPKNWLVDDDESESDEDKLIGDVGDMVKGIGNGSSNAGTTNGRVSLFNMSRRGSSIGPRPTSSSGFAKSKGKGRDFNLTDEDETNYEMLAKPSPHKAAPAPTSNLDSFLSDEEDNFPLSVATKKAPAVKPAPRPKKAPAAKKAAGPTSAGLTAKPVTLSPAAKAYALKQTKIKLMPQMKKALESDGDEGELDADEKDSSPPKAATRRPARAAVAKSKKPIYVVSDDDEMEVDESAIVEDESDDFDDSD
jgi:DNA topoisomerase II